MGGHKRWVWNGQIAVKQEAQLAIQQLLVTPPVVDLLKIITDDIPEIIGCFVGEGSSEIICMADLVLLQNKERTTSQSSV
mmetsp:Transcript_18521/g.20731  ORF Transcript_18521/g.20731 Transcript_18521/m.20731 type:complete len:80 (+) Transcript_18521:909-1148(+)